MGPEKEPRWHLIYFMTCMKVNKDLDKTEFEAPLSEVGLQHFPRQVPIPVFIGLWGSNGDHKIEFYLYQNEQKTLVHNSVIQLNYMPEQNEFRFVLMLNIEKPGPVFLDCYIGGQFLGRRALYFGKVDSSDVTNQAGHVQFRTEIDNELIAAHQACCDPELLKNPAILEYFIICEKVEATKGYYRFIREPKAIYFKAYPLTYRTTMAIGLRLSKGEHKVTIDLVNVANRARVEVGSVKVSPKSDCLLVPIEGDLLPTIPSKGLYFFNLYVDGVLVGSRVLAFEDANPMYSYSLLEEDRKRIVSGELIALMKGSIQKEKSDVGPK